MKKTLIILLASILCILFVTLGVSASSNVDNEKYIPKVITTDNGYKMMFDSELARIARRMSSDAYDVAQDSDVANDDSLAKTFKKEDFTDIQQSHTSDKFMGLFSNNFIVGVKTFEVDGVQKHVLAIAFRGTEPTEFNDLFTDASVLDANGFHTGFYMAAAKALETLYDMKFPSLNNMTFSDFWAYSGTDGSDYSILVTGHSLGGAVANIFAGDILSPVAKNNVMCYTFASPIVCSPTKAKEYDAYNIFNIINTNDIVPNVGYNLFAGVRLGTDLKVTVTDSEDNAHKLTTTYEKATNQVISRISSLYPYVYRTCYTTTENDEEVKKDEIYINANCSLDSRRFPNCLTVSKLEINGNVIINEDVIIKGDLNLNGTLDVNDNITVAGDFYNNGILKMTNEDDRVLVVGNYKQSGTSEHLTSGTLEVKGDIIESLGYTPTGTHKMVLSGDKKQNVDIYSNTLMGGIKYGWFNILEIRNASNDGVEFNDITYIHKEIFSDESKVIGSSNIYLTNAAKIRGNVWNDNITLNSWISDEQNVFNGNVYIKGNVVLKRRNTFNMDVYVYGTMKNDVDTTINGNLTIDSNGCMGLNSDFYVNGVLRSSGKILINRYKLSVFGNFSNSGILEMMHEEGKVLVVGNYQQGGTSEYLTAGTLEIKGDITETYEYKASGTHKTVLSGDKKQTVDIYSNTLMDGIRYGWFNILEIRNTSVEGIEFLDTTNVLVEIIQSVGTKLISAYCVKLQNKPAFVDCGDLNAQVNTYNGNAKNVIPTWLDYERYCNFALDGDKAFILNETITNRSFNCDLYFSNDYNKSSAVVIVAFYDGDNRFVQMASKPVDVKAGKIDVSIDYENKPYSKYKIMVWENFDNIKPLMVAK